MSHTVVKQLVTAPFLALWTLSASSWAVGDEPSSQILVSERGCCAATTGPGNKIVTHEGKTHIAWLDSTEEGFFAVVRTLDRKTGELSPKYTIGEAKDDHGRPVLTIDSKGYLHAVYGLHHDAVPYVRSRRPNDASLWTEEVVFPAKLSYPKLLCGPDDTLYLTGRHGWEGLRLYVKPPGKKWEDRGLIIRRRKDCVSYAAFHGGMAWGPDHKTLHLACLFFQGTSKVSQDWGSIQSVNYMRSRDFGRTWERADGTPIAIPAAEETMDVLVAGESMDPKPGIRGGEVVVDSTGNPYVWYYRTTPEKPGQVFLATADADGKWRQLPMQAAMDLYYPGWAVVGGTSGFTITEDDRLCMAGTVAPILHHLAHWDGKPKATHSNEPAYWQNFHPELKKVVWLESSDGGETFTAKTVIEKKPEIAHLQQSIERSTGFNRIPAGSYPGLIYHTGVSMNRDGRVVDNDVFFVDPSVPEPLPPAAPWQPAPWFLRATVGQGDVLVDWNDTPRASGYNVFRSETSGGPYAKQNAALLSESQFLDATVVGNVKYFYVVTAVYDEVETGNSIELAATYLVDRKYKR